MLKTKLQIFWVRQTYFERTRCLSTAKCESFKSQTTSFPNIVSHSSAVTTCKRLKKTTFYFTESCWNWVTLAALSLVTAHFFCKHHTPITCNNWSEWLFLKFIGLQEVWVQPQHRRNLYFVHRHASLLRKGAESSRCAQLESKSLRKHSW